MQVYLQFLRLQFIGPLLGPWYTLSVAHDLNITLWREDEIMSTRNWVIAATLLIAPVSTVAIAKVTADQHTKSEVITEVTVSAANRNLAYAQAVPEAVRQLVAKAVPVSNPLYAQAIQKFSAAQARPLKIVREQAVSNGVRMVVQVAVQRGAVERAIIQAKPALAQKRIVVLIPEAILRRPTPDPAAETELVKGFIEGGLRVVDAGQQKLNAGREILRAGSLSSEAIAQVKTRLNADILVTGEAFAEEYGAVAGGLRGYTSRLEVKVIDLASGQILHSEAFQGSAAGATDSLTGKTALMNVGRKAAASIPSAVIKAMHSDGKTTARVAAVVRVASPVTFAQIKDFSAKLKQQKDIADVVSRSLDEAGAVLEVQYQGDTASLVSLLEDFGATIKGFTGNEVTIQLAK